MSLTQAKDLVNELSTRPPKALLIAWLPLEVFEAHERLFNGGQPSVQREILMAVNALLESGKIVKVRSAEIDGLRIELFLQPGK